MSLNFITDPTPEFVYEEEMEHLTVVSRFENRAEQRRAKLGQPYKIFHLKYNIKTREEIDRLWNFYQLCQGRYKSFNFQKPIESMLPYGEAKAWWPLHEGSGTKVDDWNRYLFPTYSCCFMNDRMSHEEFSVRLQRLTLDIYQESPISGTNNYGTLAGGYSWLQCPDGSACVNFDGANAYCSMGDAADLDVGTGDFSIAFGTKMVGTGTYYLITKRQAQGAEYPGYYFTSSANQIRFRLADGTFEDLVTGAAGSLPVDVWKIITLTVDRDGAAQLYVNNVASGSPITITAVGNADNSLNFYLARIANSYYPLIVRNILFAKKVWTQAERDQIWATWRGIFDL